MKSLSLFATVLTIAFVTIFLSNCSPKVPPKSESICQGAANDGSIIVKSWGYARTQRNAIINAKKNAVQDVLFKGIKSVGASGCPSRPIVEDLSKRESDYFKKFFEKNGLYLQFVNLSTDEVPDRTKVGRFVRQACLWSLITAA